MKGKKKGTFEKIVVFSLAAVVIALLVFFLKDIFFPFIRMEIDQDFDGAKQLLRSKGILGGATVVLVEALQMVVIFIPAEFIQLSSGMSYPWYLAVILCDLGVVLGASIIYFIVHILHFEGDIFHQSDKISKYEKGGKTRSTVILMYFLFFMPIIPFGAICYFASHKRIKYPRYILTCATGVLPSICTSIIMGTAIKEFIANDLKLWALILIIIGAAAILFVLIFIILYKFYIKQNNNTPDSVFYTIFRKVADIHLKRKCKVKVTGESAEDIEGPYLVLANHASFYDFYYITAIDKKRNFCFVVNRHYFGVPIVGAVARRCGFIPKKIFSGDVETIKKIFRMKEKGYPIIMFTEGRLSNDGVTNGINAATAELAKKLGVPLVLARIENSYLMKPKWRKKFFKNTVTVNVKRIITAEELAAADSGEIYADIKKELYYDAFSRGATFRNKNKAAGLDGLLYMCPHCKTLYSTVSEGDGITCSRCGKGYTLNEKYLFDGDGIRDIHGYYEAIKDAERENIREVSLKIGVTVKIFNEKNNRYDGEEGFFFLDGGGVKFESEKSAYKFDLPLSALEGIAYSVNEEFELYHDNRLHYFYPKGEKRICTRVALLYDLLKEEYGKHREKEER
ncbi:MAG: VTT domain-containing protein [Clostridia bacterium]|nr:VTT domain-containing protein [Clostridia bacterium]